MTARYIFLLLLLLAQAVAAQAPVKEEGGKLELPIGTLYVPRGMEWSRTEVESGTVLTGRRPESSVYVVALDQATAVDNASAMALIEEHLAGPLGQKLRLRETVRVSYPWPDSLEVRLDSTSVFVGSGSAKTLLVAATGPEAAELANSVAGSFKESFQSRRDSQVKQGAGSEVLSLLGTASTMILLVGVLLPLALMIFANRRKGTAHNPFQGSLIGLAVALFLSVVFVCTVLSRFSWAGPHDYAMVVTGAVARAAFLLVIVLYLSKRWTARIASAG